MRPGIVPESSTARPHAPELGRWVARLDGADVPLHIPVVPHPGAPSYGRCEPCGPQRPGDLGGVPVFVGTRVPVQNLFDYLSAGDSLDDFLRSFPTVRRKQAVATLEQAGEALKKLAHAA